jgi:hypothetical protein
MNVVLSYDVEYIVPNCDSNNPLMSCIRAHFWLCSAWNNDVSRFIKHLNKTTVCMSHSVVKDPNIIKPGAKLGENPGARDFENKSLEKEERTTKASIRFPLLRTSCHNARSSSASSSLFMPGLFLLREAMMNRCCPV